MTRNVNKIRSIAFFFASIIVLDIILPLFSIGIHQIHAAGQSSQGMTPPNVVDLKTGDMNYSVPFIDLPGGYSFQLSYKAGIGAMEQSSWVGLGWQMEAGEITRTVNGYPDDYAGPSYENYYYGSTLPSTPSKQYKPYGCLQGYKMTLGKTVGDALPDDLAFDTYASHYGSNFQNVNYVVYPPEYTYVNDYQNLSVMDGLDSYFGGSFANYDGYIVSGGGMSGHIQPLILENPTLYHSSRVPQFTVRNSYIRKQFAYPKPNFRFVNDFSNTYTTYNVANFVPANNTIPNATIDYGANQLGYEYTTNSDGFRPNDNMRLAGSRHIEYYTNLEIADQTTSGALHHGFIGYQGMPNNNGRNTLTIQGTGVSYNVQDQIGGYSITDANGMTYHYALPVYAHKRYTYTKLPNGTHTVTEINQPYAYKWLLTTVTGKDYVDKNQNGYADESDLGNWTNFMYGRWTDQYVERTPISGNHVSQNGSEYYNTVQKEIYHLDAAYTRTHAVLFPKQGRNDAFGVGGDPGSLNIPNNPMRLYSGVLFTIDGIKSIRSIMSFSSSTIYGDIDNVKKINSFQSMSNVLDLSDLQAINSVSSTYAGLVIQESKVNQDYGLCANASTSINGTGKLTLNSVSYFGRNGSQSSPDYNFYYELSTPKTFSVSINNVPSAMGIRKGIVTFGTGTVPFKLGDIIKLSISSVTYHAVLTRWTNGNSYNVVFLGPNIPGDSQKNISVTATETKNPPYTESYYDIWGNFKSDYDNTYNYQNQYRKTSDVSAVGIDVWSLRKISTPTGAIIEVDYEADTYSDVASQEGKRILNVHPDIGFKPASNQANYEEDYNDGTYYLGMNFKMADLNMSLNNHEFMLRFLESDATDAIEHNITVGQKINMTSMCNLYNGGGSNFFTKSSDVTVVSKGSNASGPYIIVSIPQYSLSNGLPFVYNDPITSFVDYTHCVHLGSYITIGNKKMLQYGGGVRVKNVYLRGNTFYSEFKTSYDYNSSGSISYDPNQYDLIDKVYPQTALASFYPIVGSTSITYADLNKYKIPYSKLINNFEMNRFFTPAPNVNYGSVTVKNYGNDIQESTYQKYQYSVFKNTMIERDMINSTAYRNYTLGANSGGYDNLFRLAIQTEFKDLSSQAGLLLSVNTYDSQDKLIARQQYNYSDKNTLPNNQGIVGQVFHENRYGKKIHSYLQGYWIQEWKCISAGEGGPVCFWNPKYGSWTVSEVDENTYYISSSFQRYPTVLLSTESTDYLKGITEKVEYKAYDKYNGSATEIITRDSYGNVFKRKLIPHYQLSYNTLPIGLKMNGNANILNSIGEQYVYKVNPSNYDNHLAIMSANVTVLGIPKIRKYNSSSSIYEDVSVTEDANTVQSEITYNPTKKYVWNSPLLNTDGSYNSFVTFNPASIHANWKLTSEYQLGTVFSEPLSTTDINGNYTSQKLTKKKSLVLAEAKNASYNSFAFTSFEDFNDENAPTDISYLDGEVKAGTVPSTPSGVPPLTWSKTTVSGITPHTGKYICLSATGFSSPQYYTKTIVGDPASLQAGKTYRASVWMHESSASTAVMRVNVNGSNSDGAYNMTYTAGTAQSSLKSGKWYLINIDFPIPDDYESTGGTTNRVLVDFNSSNGMYYLDDFSFHPIDADTKGYVYDELTWQLNYTLDKDNMYNRYEYDNIGRLKTIYKEIRGGEVKIKDYKYNLVK